MLEVIRLFRIREVVIDLDLVVVSPALRREAIAGSRFSNRDLRKLFKKGIECLLKPWRKVPDICSFQVFQPDSWLKTRCSP